ncbi:MAG TPA: class I SAM-dependent methyltransferase [Terriglobales bacterium]|nr:class I SAM-dependent methyltransferase [Terriglobales bacterium]
MTFKAEVSQSALSRAGCPKCNSELQIESRRCICSNCSDRWEIRDGIPRFFNPGYYWGEVPEPEAMALLDEARSLGWRDAVEQRFKGSAPLQYSILNWQSRASWLPLLGLRAGAVALDVGSGYGAITHALAVSCAEVYSLEAIPLRIEFSRIRLRQEGLSNVHLMQASATQLPIRDNSFDLIVINGVLEWVGQWDTSASPEAVQLGLLQKLYRALKPEGILLIGIENRFGYNFFAGGRDHSGLPYTGLMPRWLASLVLRHSKRPPHRTELNARHQYRTYTYSELGYRRILRKAGFRYLTFYAAEPGYNEPVSLVPLRRNALTAHILRMMSEPDLGSRRRWRRLAKLYMSRLGLFRAFIPDFVIIANKDSSHAHSKQFVVLVPGSSPVAE